MLVNASAPKPGKHLGGVENSCAPREFVKLSESFMKALLH